MCRRVWLGSGSGLGRGRVLGNQQMSNSQKVRPSSVSCPVPTVSTVSAVSPVPAFRGAHCFRLPLRHRILQIAIVGFGSGLVEKSGKISQGARAAVGQGQRPAGPRPTAAVQSRPGPSDGLNQHGAVNCRSFRPFAAAGALSLKSMEHSWVARVGRGTKPRTISDPSLCSAGGPLGDGNGDWGHD